MNGLGPFLFGLVLAIVVYAIIKASHNNPKVIKIMAIIALSIGIILAVILLFFLIRVLI